MWLARVHDVHSTEFSLKGKLAKFDPLQNLFWWRERGERERALRMRIFFGEGLSERVHEKTGRAKHNCLQVTAAKGWSSTSTPVSPKQGSERGGCLLVPLRSTKAWPPCEWKYTRWFYSPSSTLVCQMRADATWCPQHLRGDWSGVLNASILYLIFLMFI